MIKLLVFIALCLISAFIVGCQHKEYKTVKLVMQIPNEKLSTIKVSTMNMLTQESVSLAEVRLDSSGKGSVTFALSKPVFAWLETTNGESRLYIKPGDELTAIFPGDILSAPSFSGTGSEVNNYIAKCYVMERNVEGVGKRNINKLDTGAFLRRLDTLQQSMARFHQQYTDSVSMPEDVISILEQRNAMRILTWKQVCGWNYGVRHDFDIPERLKVSKDIPYDSVLLNSGMFEYALLLRMNLVMKIYELAREGQGPEEKSTRSPEESIAAAKKTAFTMRDVFQKETSPPFMKEFMLAKNVGYWRETFGLNPIPDTLYSEFKRQYPSSRWLSSLEGQYQKLIAVSSDQPAPRINGSTVLGDTVSSFGLRGKVIYVDVWASWCGPCVQEIPFSEKLQRSFEGNDKVVFLNASVDNDTSAWKRSLAKYKNWKGLHIITSQAIYSDYRIQGVPHYILIDKEGKIAMTEPPRPSSGQVASEIQKLLN